MGFFDSLLETPEYQSSKLSGLQQPTNPMAGLPPQPVAPAQPPVQRGIMPPSPQGYAKGGLTAANENIQQVQIMKVFKHYFENLGVDVQQGMKNLQKEIDQGLQLIPFESSVLGYKPLSSGVAQIHFFTVGTIKDLVDDMKYFYNYLKKQGVRTIYDTMPAPITTQMLIKMGAKVEKSDNPKYQFKASI